MATLTGRREARRTVLGVGRGVEVAKVAIDTGLQYALELSINVALRAIDARMPAGQGEGGTAVVELGACPLHCRMAVLTLRGEGAAGMTRAGGLLKVRAVTREALLRGPCKLAVHVALLAVDGGVAARQGKACRAVIERRSRPVGCRVTGFACGREARLDVIRISGRVKIPRMATETLRRQTLK